MSHAVQTEKPNVPSSAALWAVLIFVGLIVAAINFVQAESKSEGHGHEATEQHGGAAHGEGHEAAGHHAAPEAAEHAPAAEGHKEDAAAHSEHAETAPAHEEAHH